jgi:long-chain fatty acid transport protein
MKKIVLLSFVATSVLMASGYQIPETSTNAVALGAANIAHNHNNADAAYYNPAKMVFMSDNNHLEADLMYIKLKQVDYTGLFAGRGPYAPSSESEDFYIPSLHYVSPKLGNSNARVGLSVTAPGGLSKRWTTQPAQSIAQEFTLETVELNPTAAFEITDKLGLAVGFRLVKTSGVVNATGLHPTLGAYSQNMTGTSTDVGYNLALEYKATDALEVGVTYRSKVDLTVEGNANLYSSAFNLLGGFGASVDVPLPATLNVAAAYTFDTKTTVEFVFERTFWSAYKTLDFNYQNSFAEALFGAPRAKNWADSTTYRVGVTQELEKISLMAGFVYDNSPVPNGTLSFELPDTKTMALSAGLRYQLTDEFDVGFAGLYSKHDSRAVNNSLLVGEFSGGDVVILSAGLGYKF